MYSRGRYACLADNIDLSPHQFNSLNPTQDEKSNFFFRPDFRSKKLSNFIPENPAQFIAFLLSSRSFENSELSIHQILIWKTLISRNWIKQF